MKEKSSIILRRGSAIYPVGFPIVAVSLDRTYPINRRTEFFAFIFQQNDQLTLRWKRIVYRNIDEAVLSDDTLLEETFQMAICELDIYLHEKRIEIEESLGIRIPYEARFSFQETSAEILRYFLIKYDGQELSQKIRNATRCNELKSALPIFPTFDTWIIEEDKI